jgi:hypothetical protein
MLRYTATMLSFLDYSITKSIEMTKRTIQLKELKSEYDVYTQGAALEGSYRQKMEKNLNYLSDTD